MSLLDDIMKALDKIDDWRKVRQLPARTDQLEQRLSELEKLVGGKVPGETCRKCGTPSMRLQRTIPLPDGITREEWLCQECGLHDKRQIALARR